MRFAFFCPPFPSHIGLFGALADVLATRGHRSTFVLNAGAERMVRTAHADVRTVGPLPARSLEAIISRAAHPGGLAGILRTVADTAALTDALCRDGPAIVRALRADAVLADQMEPAGGLIAEHLRLPFVSIASALPIERDLGVPLPFLPWPYDPGERGRRRNRAGERISKLLMMRQRQTIAAWARRFNLAPRDDLWACLSPLGTIAQTVAAFDFPRTAASRGLIAVGPLRSEPPRDEPFELDIDPGRPFAFASLGTLQGHRLDVFRKIGEACRALDAQLLVAHCGGLDPGQAAAIGATWVTDFAPQREVLKRSAVCITHAGLNTVMDALTFGVPLLAIPIAFDQPGVASRIVHHGVGLRLSHRMLSARRIRRCLETLMGDVGFRNRAAALGTQIASAGGARTAADIIEAKLAAGVGHGLGD